MKRGNLKIAVIAFPGSLCHGDCLAAIKAMEGLEGHLVSSQSESLPHPLGGIVLPGGFSYGDYIRPGVMAKASGISPVLLEEARRGTLILGICNGFQILCELGLLPGVLVKNESARFACRSIFLKVQSQKSPFLKDFSTSSPLSLPVAHGYGRYYLSSRGLKKVKDRNQIALLYSNGEGEVTGESNPNGSVENIAAVTNEEGNVLGMMPHPERRIASWLGGDQGLRLFRGFLKDGPRGVNNGTH